MGRRVFVLGMRVLRRQPVLHRVWVRQNSAVERRNHGGDRLTTSRHYGGGEKEEK